MESIEGKAHKGERMRFFIIVPIFNAQHYLHRCLDSILAQSYAHFRAILVNDGSSDESLEIAKIYAQTDERFEVISQANGGSSVARNSGLKRVREILYNDTLCGDTYTSPPPPQEYHNYIVFLDCDDYLEQNGLRILHDRLKGHRIQVLVESKITARSAEDDKIVPFGYRVFAPYLKGLYNASSIAKANNAPIATTWAFIIESSYFFAHNFAFIPHIIFEDIAFCTEVTLKAQSIYIDEAHFYNYVLTPNSIMRAHKDAQRYIKEAYSYFFTLEFFRKMRQSSDDEAICGYCERMLVHFTKELLRALQFVGYRAEVGFTQRDLDAYVPYMRGKYYFCYKYPRIYGYPKRIRLWCENVFARLCKHAHSTN